MSTDRVTNDDRSPATYDSATGTFHFNVPADVPSSGHRHPLRPQTVRIDPDTGRVIEVLKP